MMEPVLERPSQGALASCAAGSPVGKLRQLTGLLEPKLSGYS